MGSYTGHVTRLTIAHVAAADHRREEDDLGGQTLWQCKPALRLFNAADTACAVSNAFRAQYDLYIPYFLLPRYQFLHLDLRLSIPPSCQKVERSHVIQQQKRHTYDSHL